MTSKLIPRVTTSSGGVGEPGGRGGWRKVPHPQPPACWQSTLHDGRQLPVVVEELVGPPLPGRQDGGQLAGGGEGGGDHDGEVGGGRGDGGAVGAGQARLGHGGGEAAVVLHQVVRHGSPAAAR